MSKDMEKAWFDLGEVTGISDDSMIEFWKEDPTSPASIKWKTYMLRWGIHLSYQQILRFFKEDILSPEDVKKIFEKKKGRNPTIYERKDFLNIPALLALDTFLQGDLVTIEQVKLYMTAVENEESEEELKENTERK